MNRPCTCDRVLVGEPYVKGRDCWLCWLYHHDERYATLWGGWPDRSAGLDVSCIHRGEPTRTLDGCGCGSAPAVYACALKGECVALRCKGKGAAAVKRSGLTVCQDCADRLPPPPDPLPAPTVRNLMYHVAPLAANDVWRANLRQLAKRWDVFNGRKVVAIVEGSEMADPCEVSTYLDDLGCDGRTEIVQRNDVRLHEMATFLPMCDRVANDDPAQATFYGHAKGVSHVPTSSKGRAVMYWRNALYHHLLDRWRECMEQLTIYPAVGAMKRTWRDGGRGPYPNTKMHPRGLRHGNWHFAGTFFWLRHDRVFTHPQWRDAPRDKYGVEAWLSGLFRHGEVFSMWQPWPEETEVPKPYNPAMYDEPIEDEPATV